MLQTVRRLAANTFALSLARVLGLFLRIVFAGYLSRHVGDVGMGQYYLAQSVAMIAGVVGDFGLTALTVRDIGRNRDKAPIYITALAVIKLCLLIFVWIIAALLAELGDYTIVARQAIYVMVILHTMESLSLIPCTIFQAYEQMGYEALTQIVGSVLHTCLGILGVMLGYDLIQILVLLVMAGVVRLVIGLLLVLWRFARPTLALDLGLCKYLMKATVPFGILATVGILYENVYTLVLSYSASEAVVGWYGAANRLILILYLIPASFGGAIFPVFSRLHGSSPDNLRLSYLKSFNYLLLVSLPIAIGTVLIADKIILLIYGPGFENTIVVLKLLAWIILFNFVGFANGAVLSATGRQSFFAGTFSAFLVLSIVLSIVFIQRFGYLGVCYARLIVTAMDFLLYSTVCHRQMKLEMPIRVIVKAILATLIMALVIQGLRNSAFGSLWLIVGSAALVYFVALYTLRAFPRSDISAVYRVISQRS